MSPYNSTSSDTSSTTTGVTITPFREPQSGWVPPLAARGKWHAVVAVDARWVSLEVNGVPQPVPPRYRWRCNGRVETRAPVTLYRPDSGEADVQRLTAGLEPVATADLCRHCVAAVARGAA